MLLLSVICFPKPPCYFFDHVGKLRFEDAGDGSVSRFNDVLRRWFFRQVRMKHRLRNRDDPSLRLPFPDSIRKILSVGENMELAEGIVNSLIVRLLRRICCPAHRDDSHRVAIDHRSQVQHLLRKLGSEPYIGQRTLLSVCERDPELIEFLVSDHFQAWSSTDRFNNGRQADGRVGGILSPRQESAAASGAQAQALYVDRVANELAKQVCRDSSFQKLNHQLLDDLFN
ncbi:unnamed protein product [Linum tenue]|uniref:Uncharacterized protein n=1 Tax=Linum tenue TaxID=586396 RepID=A0AAV0IC91_9ROSI|nr:unnamed protein product [Linum tenue]